MDWVLFLRRIKDFVSENNGFWIHKLCVNLTFIVYTLVEVISLKFSDSFLLSQ